MIGEFKWCIFELVRGWGWKTMRGGDENVTLILKRATYLGLKRKKKKKNKNLGEGEVVYQSVCGLVHESTT